MSASLFTLPVNPPSAIYISPLRSSTHTFTSSWLYVLTAYTSPYLSIPLVLLPGLSTLKSLTPLEVVETTVKSSLL